MTKTDLRAQISTRKKAMRPEEIERCSTRLAERLFDHPAYRAARAVYGYLPFNQEVRTQPILRRALREGKRVAVPRVTDGEMEFFWLEDLEAVRPGFCGIPEPLENARVADDESALILVPGLAFDPSGSRCGYGGGFYDRWLRRHPGHPTLALCYEFQVLPRLRPGPQDIPVDYILSEPI